MKKTLIAIITILALLLSLTACGGNNSGTNQGQEEKSGVEVDKGLLDVSISLPASMFEGQSSEEVIAGAKEKGITASVNDDGSYTYVMSKVKHNEMMSEMREQLKTSFAEMTTDETYAEIIKEIKHNDNFTDITIIVDKAKYENNLFAGMSTFACGLSGMMFNTFNGTKDPKITVNVKDADSGEIINSVVYPDVMND